jgi:hypothetical protein
VNLTRAIQDNPNQSAAAKFAGAAKANPDVFYDKGGKALSVSQVMDKLNNVGSGATGLTGKTIAGATGQDEQTLTTRFDNFLQQYNELVAKTSPGDKATADYDVLHDKLQKLLQTQDQLMQQGLPPILDPKKLADADARLKQVMEDAVNPFAKQVRLADESNGLMEMRLKGLQDEADFQEKLNQLKEEGYDITKLDTKENRAAVLAAKDRTDALKAQVETIKAINEANIAAIGRKGSARDAAFSHLITPKDGETFEHAVASLSPGELAAKQQNAAVQVAAGTAQASNDISGSIREQATASRLAPSAQALRADYKSYLEQLSGIADASLDRLERRTDPALQALAKQAAEVKQALENPPGFQKWADGLEPVKKRLEDIKASFAEGLSQNITDALYGDKVDWRSFFRDISKQVTKAQVDSALGGIIGKVTGKGNLTPEQQATISAADKLTSASEQAAMAQTQAADTSAKSLDTSAANLTSAADALKGAAQSIGAGGGGGIGIGSSGAGGLADLLTSGGGVEPASITSNVSGLTSMADMLSGGGGSAGWGARRRRGSVGRPDGARRSADGRGQRHLGREHRDRRARPDFHGGRLGRHVRLPGRRSLRWPGWDAGRPGW